MIPISCENHDECVQSYIIITYILYEQTKTFYNGFFDNCMRTIYFAEKRIMFL